MTEPESPQPAAPSVPQEPASYIAGVFPGPGHALPNWVTEPLLGLQEALKMPLWLLIQNGDEEAFGNIGPATCAGFFKARNRITVDGPVGLVIDSPGGSAHSAYRIARLFQRRNREFTVIVPKYAKSAATLLALGADTLFLGKDAELGPLDVQILDPEREDVGSALDAVQALERLSAFSLSVVDQAMQMLLPRTQKKIETLLPLVLNFSASLVRPLIESIDSVDYSRKSRDLKVAEEYAIRLMTRKSKASVEDARTKARTLVEKYPTHGFVVDSDDAKALGLKLLPPDADLEPIIDMVTELEERRLSLVGPFLAGE
jgi:hypothetical protein